MKLNGRARHTIVPALGLGRAEGERYEDQRNGCLEEYKPDEIERLHPVPRSADERP